MQGLLVRPPEEECLFQTIGEFNLFDDMLREIFKCFTMELPWFDNRPYFSCIPEGIYTMEWTKRKESKYIGKGFDITSVTDRKLILMHPANFWYDLLGCIAPGDSLKDLDNDGLKDVRNSKAMVLLIRDLTKEFDSFPLEIQRRVA